MDSVIEIPQFAVIGRFGRVNVVCQRSLRGDIYIIGSYKWQTMWPDHFQTQMLGDQKIIVLSIIRPTLSFADIKYFRIQYFFC